MYQARGCLLLACNGHHCPGRDAAAAVGCGPPEPGSRCAASERGLLMETSTMMFLDCPEYLDQRGAGRCGLPAEVEARYVMGSTDGPLESLRIRCPRGHWFN